MSRSLITLCFFTLGCGSSTPLPRVQASQLVDCDTCPIRLRLVAELGSPDDTIWGTAFSGTVRMGDGRFVITTADHPGVQIVYSPSGALQGTFGRSGNGPGEYSPWTVPHLGPGDTLSIIDMMYSRRTLVDSAGRPIRDHRLPSRFRRATFLGDRMIVQADIATPDLRGVPLHEVDPSTGEILRSFAAVESYSDPFIDGVRILAAAGDSGVWVAPPTELRFELFDRNLVSARTIVAEEDWFPPHRNSPGASFDVPPDPRLIAVWQAENGLLWAIVRVADAEWEPRPPPTVETAPSVEDSRLTADWVLAVFDPVSGDRLAAVQFDEGTLKGHGDDLIYMFVSRPDDGASFAAYEVIYTPK